MSHVEIQGMVIARARTEGTNQHGKCTFMRAMIWRTNTDDSIVTSCISKPCSLTGTASKLAMSRPQDRVDIAAAQRGRDSVSPLKLKNAARSDMLIREIRSGESELVVTVLPSSEELAAPRFSRSFISTMRQTRVSVTAICRGLEMRKAM